MYLHLKILVKAHFYQARAGKLIFKSNLNTQLLEFDTQLSLFTESISQQISESNRNYPEWNKHVFLNVSEMFYFTSKS